MDDSNYFVFARMIHIAGIVMWIGGVAFVTTVLLPALRRIANPQNRLELFEQLEGRFALQAKLVTLITAISGIYMLEFMNAWDRYQYLQFWWMHLMTFIWAIFTLVLFVLEPLVLHQWFHKQAANNSEKAFAMLHRMHWILLSLSLLAVMGAVAGSHGFHV